MAEPPTFDEDELRELSPEARIRKLREIEAARRQHLESEKKRLEEERERTLAEIEAAEERIKQTEEELDEAPEEQLEREQRAAEVEEETLEEIVEEEEISEEALKGAQYKTGAEEYRTGGPGLEYDLGAAYQQREGERGGLTADLERLYGNDERRTEEEMTYRQGPADEQVDRGISEGYTRRDEGLSTNILKDLYRH